MISNISIVKIYNIYNYPNYCPRVNEPLEALTKHNSKTTIGHYTIGMELKINKSDQTDFFY